MTIPSLANVYNEDEHRSNKNSITRRNNKIQTLYPEVKGLLRYLPVVEKPSLNKIQAFFTNLPFQNILENKYGEQKMLNDRYRNIIINYKQILREIDRLETKYPRSNPITVTTNEESMLLLFLAAIPGYRDELKKLTNDLHQDNHTLIDDLKNYKMDNIPQTEKIYKQMLEKMKTIETKIYHIHALFH